MRPDFGLIHRACFGDCTVVIPITSCPSWYDEPAGRRDDRFAVHSRTLAPVNVVFSARSAHISRDTELRQVVLACPRPCADTRTGTKLTYRSPIFRISSPPLPVRPTNTRDPTHPPSDLHHPVTPARPSTALTSSRYPQLRTWPARSAPGRSKRRSDTGCMAGWRQRGT